MEAFRTAYVYVRNVFAGILAKTDSGYSFSYNNDYLKSDHAAVSLVVLKTTRFNIRESS